MTSKQPRYRSLLALASSTIRNRLQKSSKAPYSTGWRSWVSFSKLYNLPVGAPTQESLLAWAAYLVQTRNIRAQTIRTYAYGIQSELKARHKTLRISARDMPVFHAFLHGRSRQKPPKSPKHPITNRIISIWFNSLKKSKWDNVVWRTYAAISHNSIRRNAEMARCDINGISFKMFLWSSGTYKPRMGKYEKWVCLFFNKSKMNTTGRPQVALMPCKCPNICAMHELEQLSFLCPSITPNGRVFKFTDGSVLNYAKSLKWIKERCKETGMDPTKFGTHGFRSGGAIDQMDQGISTNTIMQQAGWASIRSLKRYVDKRTAPQLLNSALISYGLKPHKMPLRAPIPMATKQQGSMHRLYRSKDGYYRHCQIVKRCGSKFKIIRFPKCGRFKSVHSQTLTTFNKKLKNTKIGHPPQSGSSKPNSLNTKKKAIKRIRYSALTYL